jgi:luciferase family oxidoreductase group 1
LRNTTAGHRERSHRRSVKIPVWILGSSLFGAQVAAALGLPFAFASHFAPAQMMEALDIYRARFRPSQQLGEPYAMLGFNVFAADTDDEAHLLASSMQQAFVHLLSGRPSRLQPPVPGYRERLGAPEQALLQQVLSCSAIGSPSTVQREIAQFIARTGANELMINSNIFDHAARLHSFEIASQARPPLTAV